MSDSVVLGGNFDDEQPYYQPPIVTSVPLSIGINKHTTVRPSNVSEAQARLAMAQKRAKQAAYRALLDHDRVAVIPVSRAPIPLPSPSVEATGFMVGAQRVEEEPPSKKDLQQQYKQELAQFAAMPAISAERRPFPHRAYTPALRRDERNAVDSLEDSALAELLKRRAEVRANLRVDRSDVIEQMAPGGSSVAVAARQPLLSFREKPVGGRAAEGEATKKFTISPGKAPTTGLAIGPDAKEEKSQMLQKNAAFMQEVRRDAEYKATLKAKADADNLAVLLLARSQSLPGGLRLGLGGGGYPSVAQGPHGNANAQAQTLGASPSASRLADAFVDKEGATGILIGGETSDVIRGRTAQVKKRVQQEQYRRLLETQLAQKKEVEARASWQNYSLTKPQSGPGAVSFAATEFDAGGWNDDSAYDF